MKIPNPKQFLKPKRRKNVTLETPTFQGEKVILRKIELRDALYAYDVYEDLRFQRFSPFNQLLTVDDVTMYLMQFISSYENGISVGWSILNKRNDEFLGILQLQNVRKEDKVAELSFFIADGVHPSYLAEALWLAIDYLLPQTFLHRLEVLLMEKDSLSESTMKTLGFHFEGVKRKSVYLNEVFYDAKMYSILEEEWKN